MIVLTRQNETHFALNDDLIETIEECPDTTIKLTNGKIYIVAESLSEVLDKIIELRQKCVSNVYIGAQIKRP
ncbi:MAG: flagellar FlbD family protein [Ruminococcus sp.]|nr:flagellar FlbD family protein [Ruminococcus sp.]MBR1753106.1 flagellar FlbD family protein [Ruminococcus sp.]